MIVKMRGREGMMRRMKMDEWEGMMRRDEWDDEKR